MYRWEHKHIIPLSDTYIDGSMDNLYMYVGKGTFDP